MLSSALANSCRPTFSGSVKAVGRDWYEFLDAVFGAATNHMTVEGYAKRFRQIVSDIFGLSNGAAKYDYRQGGQQKWLEKVCSIKLREITPDKVQDWKRSCLAQAGDDSLALRKVRISVNSTMRQARSLFSRKMLRHLKLSLPDPLPFGWRRFRTPSIDEISQ